MKSKTDATKIKESSKESFTSDGEDQKMDSDYNLNEKSEQANATDDDEGSNVFSALYGFLFPKVAPISLTTFLSLSFLIAIPTAGYIVAFTKMGFGNEVYYFISEYLGPIAYYIAGGLAGAAFTLYLMDMHYWTSETGIKARNIFYTVFVGGILVLGIFLAGSYPYFPVAVFTILLPFYLEIVRKVFYSTKTPREYIYWLSGPLSFVAIGTISGWVAWTLVSIENEYNLGVALNEAEESGCVANYDDYPDCDIGGGKACFYFDAVLNRLDFSGCDDGEICQQLFEECYNPFIIWVGPFLASFCLLTLSFIASFLRGDGSIEQEASRFMKVWILLIFSLWVVASLSGAGAGATPALMSSILALFIASGIFVNVAFNSSEKKERMQKILEHLTGKYGAFFNLVRGMLIVTCTPVFLMYLAISFCIQRIRSVAYNLYTTPPSSTESLRNIPGEGLFTIEGRRLIRTFQSWPTTRVFSIAIWCGIFFMVLYVIVAEFTILFLSWLIETTSDMSVAVVTIILVSVGMTMFLLPPISGVPIYLTLGIVIIPVARPYFGIFWSITYATAVSVLLKLLACTLQQKLIGGMLSGNVGVRKFCAVNSNVMRSAKLVLKQPGLGLAKVCILIGCPDWPTSVLCGIMGLPLIPILVGTLPIVFLILPTLLTGSFMYMADARVPGTDQLEFPWAGTMATVFAFITAVVQFGSMIVAAYFIERVIEEKKDELDAIPIDQEVRVLEEKTEEHNKAYEEVSVWQTIPFAAQFTLCISLSCMIICCYMVAFFSCFRDYQLTYTIATNLDGDWLSLVKPLGWVAIGLFTASLIFFFGFRSWANQKATEKCKADAASIYPENGDGNYELHKSYDQEEQKK